MGETTNVPFKLLSPQPYLRFVAYGYRVSEVVLPKMPMFKKELAIRLGIRNDVEIRNPMMISAGPHIVGALAPHPDTTDAHNALAGVLRRIGTEPPPVDMNVVKELRDYVYVRVRQLFPKLSADADVSFETFIENTQYSRGRKEELRAVWTALQDKDKEDIIWERAKCFIKAEQYPEYKYPRGIFSRTDEYKVMVGPYFKQIENVVYKHPAFVKHTPVHKRPDHVLEVLDQQPGEEIDATDYSSFESLFRDFIMFVCEFELYLYMTEDIPDGGFFSRRLEAMLVDNELLFKWFTVYLRATRLSGGMETSLGNGFSNLMFGEFVCKRKGCTNVRMVVEGDDGLLAYDGPRLSAEDFSKMGLSIKLIRHSRIETASFCGIIFDSEEKRTLREPLMVLTNFAWMDGRYLNYKHSKIMGLLRCKSLSLAYQYPGCPILWALADYGLRVTKSYRTGRIVDDPNISWWQRNMYKEALSHQSEIKVEEPGMRSRLLIEELYGVPISAQIAVEEMLNRKTDLLPINMNLVLDLVPGDWKHFFENYTQGALKGAERRPTIKTEDWSVTNNGSLLPLDNHERLKKALRGRKRRGIRKVAGLTRAAFDIEVDCPGQLGFMMFEHKHPEQVL